MVKNIQGNFFMMKKMDREPAPSLMEMFIKVNGKMINIMAKAPRHMLMGLLKRVYGKMVLL